jgi:hypothetical protein
MNRPRSRFQTLVQRARGEPVPAIDVAARVARSLEPPLATRNGDGPLWVATAVSVAAAAAVLLAASLQGALFDDPFATWLRPLVLVMQ